MTDLVITPADVQRGAGAITKQVSALSAVTAGQVVYKDSTTSNRAPADADGAADMRVVEGIALGGAAADQPFIVQTDGDIELGSIITVGEIYVLSDTAGGIMPAADLEAGDYVSIIGVGISNTTIRLGILNSGVAVPAP